VGNDIPKSTEVRKPIRANAARLELVADFGRTGFKRGWRRSVPIALNSYCNIKQLQNALRVDPQTYPRTGIGFQRSRAKANGIANNNPEKFRDGHAFFLFAMIPYERRRILYKSDLVPTANQIRTY
jgi:hypothetical protein